MISEILRLFVNSLAPDNSNCLLKRGNLLQHFQIQLSQKQKTFSKYSFHFLNLDSICNIFKKKDDNPSSCIFGFTVSEKRNYINV